MAEYVRSGDLTSYSSCNTQSLVYEGFGPYDLVPLYSLTKGARSGGLTFPSAAAEMMLNNTAWVGAAGFWVCTPHP